MPEHHVLAGVIGEEEMDRDTTLKKAMEAVSQDRIKNYGLPEKNFQVIADFWTTYLGNKYNIEFILTGIDVALMQDLLKTARLISNPYHEDSWVDKAGYSACGSDCAQEEKNIEETAELLRKKIDLNLNGYE